MACPYSGPCFHKLCQMFMDDFISRHEVLQFSGTFIARFDQDEDAFVILRAPLNEGRDAIGSQVRRDGERIDRTPGEEIGIRVRLTGGTDIISLSIGDDEESLFLRIFTCVPECFHAQPTEELEESHLGFYTTCDPFYRIDDAFAKCQDPPGIFLDALRKFPGMRIQSHADGGSIFDAFGEGVGEVHQGASYRKRLYTSFLL